MVRPAGTCTCTGTDEFVVVVVPQLAVEVASPGPDGAIRRKRHRVVRAASYLGVEEEGTSMVTVVPRPRDRDREPPQRMPQYPTPRTPQKQQRHPAAAATHTAARTRRPGDETHRKDPSQLSYYSDTHAEATTPAQPTPRDTASGEEHEQAESLPPAHTPIPLRHSTDANASILGWA